MSRVLSASHPGGWLLVAMLMLFLTGSPVLGAGNQREPAPKARKARCIATEPRHSVNRAASGLPNLTPYQPDGWSDKIVVSSQSGENSGGILHDNDTLSTDWAVENNGEGTINQEFHTALYIDDELIITFNTSPPLAAAYYTYYEDWRIGSLSAGTHTFKIVADYDNRITESDETDNEYTKIIIVSSVLNGANPLGWEDLAIYGGTIYALAIDPVDPNIMFAGSYYGDGLFKSIDGGTTWQSVDGFRNQVVYDISFDPRHPTTIWVATFWYIYKSADGGTVWTSLDPASSSSGLGNYRSLAIDPVDSDTIYVGTAGLNSSNDNASVFKTTDGGATWQQASLAADHNVWDLEVNPGNPQEIWAVTGPEWVDAGSIYRSRNGGVTWAAVDTGLPPGWFWFVRVDPRDSRTVFVGGENGLYRSRDGGLTWSQLIASSMCRALAFDPFTPNRVYAHAGWTIYNSNDLGDTWVTYPNGYDLIFLCPHPGSAGVLFAADVNHGVLKSTDSGQGWQSANQGVRANAVYASTAGRGGAVAAATQAGIFLKRSGGGWERIHSQSAYSVAFHPTDGDTIFVGNDWYLRKTTDSGVLWSYVEIPSNESNRVAAIALDPQNPEALYVGVYYRSGTRGEIYKSSDGGASLQRMESFDVPVNALAIDPHNPRIIYAGTGMFFSPGVPGGAYKSIDGGTNWMALKTGVTVNAISLDPQDPDTIYLACGESTGEYGGLYKSTDGGVTWQEKDFGIPSRAIPDVAVALDNPNVVFAATHRSGVYVSADGGNYWTRIGLSDYWLYDILVNSAGASPSKLKRGSRSGLIDSSSNLYAGSASGMLGYTGAGQGVISGVVRAVNSNTDIDFATLSTDTGGVALSLAGNYLMVTPAGHCTVTASLDGYQSAAQAGVVVPSGGQVTVDLSLLPLERLYFPHIVSNSLWESEVALINTSATETVTGTLRPFGDSGAAVSTPLPVTLAPHGRRQVTVSQEFTSPGSIGYLVFESDSSSIKGYSKLFRAGNDRVALPAVGRINSGTILMPHLASTGGWQTQITLVNTTASTISASLEFSTGQTSTLSLGAGERRVFTVADLFGGQAQDAIISGLIRNGAGLIGAELFSSGSLLSGVLLEDRTAQTIYYPHVASSGGWWTGMVAYNPSTTPCTLTVTPYSEAGVALAAQTVPIASGQKYIGTADTLQLPAETAWMQISGTSETTGFELFGSGSQLAGYTGVGIRGKEGIFAKIEKQGWTGIAFVNTEDTTATVTLTAYGDSGAVVATATRTVPGHQKVVDLAESLFSQDISTATYISYSSDKEVVGFQLNSVDPAMLDALPGL